MPNMDERNRTGLTRNLASPTLLTRDLHGFAARPDTVQSVSIYTVGRPNGYSARTLKIDFMNLSSFQHVVRAMGNDIYKPQKMFWDFFV